MSCVEYIFLRIICLHMTLHRCRKMCPPSPSLPCRKGRPVNWYLGFPWQRRRCTRLARPRCCKIPIVSTCIRVGLDGWQTLLKVYSGSLLLCALCVLFAKFLPHLVLRSVCIRCIAATDREQTWTYCDVDSNRNSDRLHCCEQETCGHIVLRCAVSL